MLRPLLALSLTAVLPLRAAPVFVEAEAFARHGGWTLDTQFIQIMGSSYLLAHGMGKPVAEATTQVSIPAAGEYRVWVRTKDWVAPWNAPGTPGRFQLALNGQTLPVEFGTSGAEWHWQDGGTVTLTAGDATLALRDLTGFDGRCDAILLSPDKGYRPPDGGPELETARAAWLGRGAEPDDAGEYDLVVCGGGYAGMATAISAARHSLRVALVQDRFVLGGNGSSEIRVWANGGTMRGKYPHLGEIVEEFADHARDSPGLAEDYGDALKEAVVRNEKTLTLFLGHFVRGAATDPDTGRIRSVTALDVRTGHEKRFRGTLFADCTGHGVLGAAAGAAFRQEPRGRMGMSNMWYWQDESTPQPWPETPWALPLTAADFPKSVRSKSPLDGRPFLKAEWFWESGFDKDPIRDLELIRDWNLGAAFGAFSAIKHGDQQETHPNAALKWVAAIGGPRESRLLDGDVILSREDIVSQREFPDGSVPTTWDIDLHYPKDQFAKKFPDNPFISRAEFGAGVDRKAGYPVPYRCFYSRNVPNLFMAGRNISVTHEALGTVRVMRTCGMMGEVVGKAAWICIANRTDPRGVYANYLPVLLDLMEKPGAMRRASLEAPLENDPAIARVRAYHNKSSDVAATVAAATTDLPGIVIDDTQATLTGEWTGGSGLPDFTGAGYHYASPQTPAAAAAFAFTVPAGGECELRLAWSPHENRSTKTACTLQRDGQPDLTLRLNQREGPTGFHSLGRFPIPAGKPCQVILSTEGADGLIHADALQILPAKAE